VDLGLLYEASLSHSDTAQSVEQLWTVISSSQRPVPVNKQQSHDTDFTPAGGIRTRNPNKRAGIDQHLRPGAY